MKNYKQVAIWALVLAFVLGATVAVSAQTALQANILGPANGSSYAVGQLVSFGASAEGGSAPYVYNWDFGDGSSQSGQSFDRAYTQAGSRTVKLTVTDFAGATAEATRNITITSGTSNPLTISNVRVTDVTKNSAVVRWTTNKPATSRVIYDTVSHATLGSAPNYGYANTTGTTDVDTKVTEHAVTVSGLSSQTTYYFRVISEA